MYNNALNNGEIFTDWSKLKPGDRIYFNVHGRGVSHVGEYTGRDSNGNPLFSHWSNSGFNMDASINGKSTIGVNPKTWEDGAVGFQRFGE
jgi:cell wall-associated NlpC family hydrolase